MKTVLRVAGVIVGLLLVLGIVQLVASESGEVVILTTLDAHGKAHETRLWVVDHEDRAWLRAGAQVQGWYQRLLVRPAVEVERAGIHESYTAVPRPDLQAAVDERMLEKYGWADRLIGLLFGRDDAVPIRLDPRRADTPLEAAS